VDPTLEPKARFAIADRAVMLRRAIASTDSDDDWRAAEPRE